MKFCENCGSQVSETARYCSNCGQEIAAPMPVANQAPQVYPMNQVPMAQPAEPVYMAQSADPARYQMPQQEQYQVPGGVPSGQLPPPPQGSAITLYPDGKYRWVYEYNLFTNPTIFFTIFKIFIGIVLALFLLMLVFEIINGDFSGDTVLDGLKSAGIALAIMLALTIVGYLVYAIMQGGKYCVLFTMDVNGVEHKQLPKQYKKAQIVSALNVLLGIATGNPTEIGVGLLSARDSLSSDFGVVHSIRGSRRGHTIKVNEALNKNQVYVENQDYDFVLNFIRDHCPNAKIVRG
ncbi:MAG: zinc-ribbon domain-containing protein [Coriobacteriales bacterium]|nr:zinc-ribbon domain-containing protein [Coriobacteriales bacterium]